MLKNEKYGRFSFGENQHKKVNVNSSSQNAKSHSSQSPSKKWASLNAYSKSGIIITIICIALYVQNFKAYLCDCKVSFLYMKE